MYSRNDIFSLLSSSFSDEQIHCNALKITIKFCNCRFLLCIIQFAPFISFLASFLVFDGFMFIYS
jgi:hypothetical protein